MNNGKAFAVYGQTLKVIPLFYCDLSAPFCEQDTMLSYVCCLSLRIIFNT
jgi:hypothetical protein